MVIEIKEKGSEQFYREVVSVTAQYQSLLRKPDQKYKDIFKTYRNMFLLMCVLFVLMLFIGFSDGFTALTIAALVTVAIAAMMTVLYSRMMRKHVKRYLEDGGSSVVTLDENGIELKKEKVQTIRLAWDNVALVRKFDESVCFFAKETTRIVIAVTAEYEKEIDAYLTEHAIDVRRI